MSKHEIISKIFLESNITRHDVIMSEDGFIGERLRALWEGNLKVLNWEKDFLAPFRTKNSTGGYIGLGKTLSGLINVARHLGGEADMLRIRIVSELISTQEADGYIGLYEQSSRTYKVWDVHEQAYIMQALIEDAAFFENSESLQAAERLARWLLPRISEDRWREVGKDYIWSPLAIIGLDRAFQTLSRATGDSVFADFCRDELGIPKWCDPIVEGRQGQVCGHAYAYIARCLAQLEMDNVKAANVLPEATQAVISYLRAGGGLIISGTCGHTECWHSDQRLDGHLGETCTTAYLVRWAAHLLHRTNDAWFGDLMERAIYNALFAASSTDGRQIRYYSAAEGKRKWYEVDTYCCPGNYRRIIGELPDFISRPYNGGLAIDLYEACQMNTFAGGQPVHLQITTKYPFDNLVTLRLSPEYPGIFPLYLRYPGWADGVTIFLNDEKLSIQPQNGWITIERCWQGGDRLDISFNLHWRLIRGFRKQINRVAIMRGPLVWGADPINNEALGDSLPNVIPNILSCRMNADVRRATIEGTLDGNHVEIAIMPFAELDTAVTYFTGSPGMGDERDHIMWLAPDPIGVGQAPGT